RPRRDHRSRERPPEARRLAHARQLALAEQVPKALDELALERLAIRKRDVGSTAQVRKGHRVPVGRDRGFGAMQTTGRVGNVYRQARPGAGPPSGLRDHPPDEVRVTAAEEVVGGADDLRGALDVQTFEGPPQRIDVVQVDDDLQDVVVLWVEVEAPRPRVLPVGDLALDVDAEVVDRQTTIDLRQIEEQRGE